METICFTSIVSYHKTQHRIVHLAYLNTEYVFANYIPTSLFSYFIALLKSEGDLFLTK